MSMNKASMRTTRTILYPAPRRSGNGADAAIKAVAPPAGKKFAEEGGRR